MSPVPNRPHWLFIGDAGAGERSAIICTIIESCRRQQIDTSATLRDVLTRLPTMTNWQIKDITPQAWTQEQKQVQRQAARPAHRDHSCRSYDIYKRLASTNINEAVGVTLTSFRVFNKPPAAYS